MLLSPLGLLTHREIFNLACEDVATRAAIDLVPTSCCCSAPSLLDADGKLIRELRPQQVAPHLQRLGSDYQGELLDAAAEACKGGVARSHRQLCRRRRPADRAVHPRRGGTLVSQEQFEVVREATIEDVGGLLDLISPLEEQGILVRRSRGCWSVRSSNSVWSSAKA